MQISSWDLLSLLDRLGFGAVLSAPQEAATYNATARMILAADEGRSGMIGCLPLAEQEFDRPFFVDETSRRVVVQRFRLSDNEGWTLVLLADLRRRHDARPCTLRRLFDLTPCEARVAAALSAGHSLGAIARRNAVKIGTIRWQLKSIFTKTATRRQLDLALLISRFAPFEP